MSFLLQFIEMGKSNALESDLIPSASHSALLSSGYNKKG
jgi:hypothetical protein